MAPAVGTGRQPVRAGAVVETGALRLLGRLLRPSRPHAGPAPEDFSALPPDTSGYARHQRAFIVSTGRTGTHFLADYLNRGRLIPAAHQPQPDGLDVGNAFARGRMGAEEVARWLRQRDLGEVVEVTPYFFSLLAPIHDLWPTARLAVVIRHPLAYCRSAYGHWGGWYDRPDDAKFRVRAADFPDDPYHDAWDDLTRAEKIVWLWRYQNMVMCRDLPPDGLLVRFEDIFTPPHAGMARLFDHLGLAPQVDARMMGKRLEESRPGTETLPEGETAFPMKIAADWDWQSDPRVRSSVAPYFC